MAADCKARYDSENDILLIRRVGARPAGAIEVGQIIISFEDDQLNRLAALEILDASKVLSELHHTRITPTLLEKVGSVRIALKHANNMLFVAYTIQLAAMAPLTSTIPLPRAAEA